MACALRRYEDGRRVGEGVRILDETKLKKDEPKGPYKLSDGRIHWDEISVAEAEAIAASIGFKGGLPVFPWPPAKA